MGKKGKAEEIEQYEIWILHGDGTYKQVVEGDNAGIFTHRARALAIASSKSGNKGVVETMVISRRPIATFNGEAISLKGQLSAVQKKKEEPHGVDKVHGDRPKEGDDKPAGDQHVREASAPGSGGEGTP
jgi:hypothetical protein